MPQDARKALSIINFMDMFPVTIKTLKIAVDMFPHTDRDYDVLPVLSCNVETVCLLSKKP